MSNVILSAANTLRTSTLSQILFILPAALHPVSLTPPAPAFFGLQRGLWCRTSRHPGVREQGGAPANIKPIRLFGLVCTRRGFQALLTGAQHLFPTTTSVWGFTLQDVVMRSSPAFEQSCKRFGKLLTFGSERWSELSLVWPYLPTRNGRVVAVSEGE